MPNADFSLETEEAPESPGFTKFDLASDIPLMLLGRIHGMVHQIQLSGMH